MVVTRTISPTTTETRNTGTHLLGMRTYLGDRDDDDDEDNDVRASKIRDELERLCREMRRVIDLPLANAVVDLHELRVGPHEVGEESEHETACHCGYERNRERETRCRGRVRRLRNVLDNHGWRTASCPSFCPAACAAAWPTTGVGYRLPSRNTRDPAIDRDEEEDQNRHLGITRASLVIEAPGTA